MRSRVKLLHTADWHWGLVSWRDSPRSVDRNPEIRSALEDIYNHAFSERPDCILIAGDVFNHYVAPSESDAKEIISFMIELSKIAPIVMVLGNHDWRGLSTYNLFSLDWGYTSFPLFLLRGGPFRGYRWVEGLLLPLFPVEKPFEKLYLWRASG